ncbi:MAG: DJ-1/PfpI family protein [Nanoarchaeota archaeon]
MSKVLFVIAPVDFRDEEYLKPKEILEKAGYIVITASTTQNVCKGMHKATVKPDILIRDAVEANFSALVVVGGNGSPKLWANTELQELFHDFYDANKLIACICLATVALFRSGLTQGKKVTGWLPEAKEEADKNGAIYVTENIIEDDLFITAKGPSNAEEFGHKILKRLKSK